MKTLFSIEFIVINALIFSESLVAGEKLYATSPFFGSQALYFEIKKSNSQNASSPEESPRLRNEICEAIVSSTFISDIYNVHSLTLNHSKGSPLKMTSPFKLHNVSAGHAEYEEFLFSCSSRNHKTGKDVEFYISREYGYGETSDSDPTLPGIRFVFKRDEDEQLVASALAEEPARVASFVPKNKVEYTAISESLLKIDERSRAICILPAPAKYRLCSIVLNAKQYQNTLKFPFSPSEMKNELQCEEELLTFEYDYGFGLGEEEEFNEWVIICKARLIDGTPTNRSVSLGLKRNEFLVSEMGNGNKLKDHCFIPQFAMYSYLFRYNNSS